MYSWGNDTATWKGGGSYSFDSAAAPYLDKAKAEADAKGPRTYATAAKAKGPKLDVVDPKLVTLESMSEDVVILGVDGTGSMKTWPAEIFDRLPLFYQTLASYRPGLDVSFSVIGDAISDQWPVQTAPFGRGPTLDDHLKALHAEGGGGPGVRESYELWGHLIDTKANVPNADRPFLFVMGDEAFYNTVDPKHASHYLGMDGLQEGRPSMEVWHSLREKFDVYLLRKPLDGRSADVNRRIEEMWGEAIGEQKVIPVYDPLRVVDVAMGIVAKRWGHFEDFTANLAARQDSENISTVMASLKAAPGFAGTSASVMASMAGSAPKSVPLVGGEE
jgi:hypothetical protein